MGCVYGGPGGSQEALEKYIYVVMRLFVVLVVFMLAIIHCMVY